MDMVEETLSSSENPAEPMPPAAADAQRCGSPLSTAASAPTSAAVASSASTADESSDDKSRHAPPIPRWLFNVFGHALAALLGLLLGVLILWWLRPDIIRSLFRLDALP
jgi:hypothetical protein